MTWDKIKHDFCVLKDKAYWNIWFRFIEKPFTSIHDFIRYDIPYGVRNLIVWFPIIWTDRNWDFCYIEYILKKKLEIMIKTFEKCNNHEGTKQYVKEMKQCVRLIDRIHNDDYGYITKHDEKWGEGRINFEPAFDRNSGDIDPNFVQATFYRPNVHNPEQKEQERLESLEAYRKEEAQKKNDYKALFGIISKRIEYWWD